MEVADVHLQRQYRQHQSSRKETHQPDVSPGCKDPGTYPGLEGGGDTARYLKFENEDDLAAKTDELTAVVKGWIDWKA